MHYLPFSFSTAIKKSFLILQDYSCPKTCAGSTLVARQAG